MDVSKGSPLFPACFFPFYILRIYQYVRRIWLGDRPDVRLVSYHRDLGVWMFPEVRRVRFFVGHTVKAECCLCTFFFFFFFFFFIYFYYFLRYKHPYADRSKTGKTSTYSPTRIPCAKTLSPCPTPKRPVLCVETREEPTGLIYNEQKTSTDVQSIRKTPHPNREQPRNVLKPQPTQGRQIPAKPLSNPPTAQ